MSTLAPADWVRKANELQRSAGKPLSREAIEQRIGKPSGRVTRKSSTTKGGKWGVRTGDRSGQTQTRNQNIKDATGPQSTDDKKKVRNIKAKRSRLRKQGQDVEVLHPQGRPSLVGPQVRDAERRGVSGASVREKLRKSYPIGDDPKGLSLGSGADNRAEDADWQRVQRRLGEKEKENPSLNNHPNLSEKQNPPTNQTPPTPKENLLIRVLSSPQLQEGLQRTGQVLSIGAAAAGTLFSDLLRMGRL